MPGNNSEVASGNIIFLEEDDDYGVELSRLERLLRRLKTTSRSGQTNSVPAHTQRIDLTQDDETQRSIIDDYEERILHELEAADDERPGVGAFSAKVALSHGPPLEAQTELHSYRHKNMLFKKGTVVEVSPRPYEQYCWQFLRVTKIYTIGRSSNVVLLGTRLARTRHLRGMLPRLKNEVCALYDLSEEDKRSEDLRGLVEVPVFEVIRTRGLTVTNAPFPEHRFSPDDWNRDVKTIEQKAHLTQRWKFYRYWSTNADMKTKRSYSGAFIRLRSTDIEDKEYRVADDKLRNEFRGGITRGGSWISDRVAATVIDLDAPHTEDAEVTLGHNQVYTADDMFCGAGGATCGQEKASIRVMFACDMDKTACETHRQNFPEALLQQMNIFDFIKLRSSAPYSDFLNISPPCQVFSPAHTHAGRNDEANVAALFACGETLQEIRPRISTGEQTFGLLFDRNEEFFNALIRQYTELGYSFRWDMLKFKDYGVASTRRRLIWIASCPGEPLPDFPAPTHSDTDPRLPNPITLGSVLASIPRNSHPHDPLHNINQMLSAAQSSGRFPRRPYPDNCQVGTITTAGSEWVHPSGERDFTLRELACIQGFPLDFKFEGGVTQIRRQIGNAFPPVVVETLYRHLRECLLREDRVVASQPSNQANVIDLDPIDDDMPIERIVIDDSDDDMEEPSAFSRESSCTLARSLASLMEIDDPRN